jgi:polyhydroxyalkanoate synthesis regulator phasin
MKHMPRRNAVIAAATSVIMLGGVAIAVPAIAASAQKSHRTTVAVHKSTHAANTSSTIPSPLATALVPPPSGPDKDNDGPDFGAPDKDNDGPDFGALDNENDGPGFDGPDNENDGSGFGRGGNHGGPGLGFAAYTDFTSVLTDLVTKGTLTQAASTAVTTALDAAEAAEHVGMPMPKAMHGTSELPAVLKDLVTKGTLTQAQADAIANGLAAKQAAAQAAEQNFRTQADAVIAQVLGITVDQLSTARRNHVKPQVTDAQRAEIKSKLDALRTSLGLPTPPQGLGSFMGRGMGGHHDGRGNGRFGKPAPSTTAPAGFNG